MLSEQRSNTSSDTQDRAMVGQPSLAAAALEYLGRGWSVIPLTGKLPAVATWKEYQSHVPTSSEIHRWFVTSERRPSGIGVVTGKLSGLVVVDCDSVADATFWQESHASSPFVASTGGGGYHFYYAPPDDSEIRNRVKVLGRKIDIRGEGGYAAIPPSLHPNGKLYAWLTCDTASKLPKFNPAWLLGSSQLTSIPSSRPSGDVRNAVAYIRRIRAVAGEGGHNATFRAACKLRDAGLSDTEAASVLRIWNETNAHPRWSEAELLHKVRSAFKLVRETGSR